MPNSQTETFEAFAYEGVLNWISATWLFVAASMMVGTFLWRERHVIGEAIVGLFFVLRVVAIALVVWMLLGPTYVSTDRISFPNTIALVVDNSASMSVSDELPSLERMRWNLAIDGIDDDIPELIGVDRALAATRYALQRVHRLADETSRYATQNEIQSLISSLYTCVEVATGHLRSMAKNARNKYRDLADRVTYTADWIERELQPEQAKLRREWSSLTPMDLNECLSLIEEGLTECELQMQTYQSEIVATLRATSNSAFPGGEEFSRCSLSSQVVKRLEEGILSQISEKVNVRRVAVSSESFTVSDGEQWPGSVTFDEPSDGQSETAMTDLSSAMQWLDDYAASESIVAAVLLTDGHHNAASGPQPNAIAARLTGLPVFAVPLGIGQEQRDVFLSMAEAPRTVALNDEILFSVIVSGVGLRGERISVDLSYAGETIASRDLEFDSNRQDHKVRFQAKAEKEGWHEYDLVVTPVEGEISDANNSSVMSVRVVKDKYRILLADRITRWEFRYLENLFLRDDQIEFDKLLFEPRAIATGKLQGSKALPRDVDRWSEYDVVILGDLEPKHFDRQQQASLHDWIELRGGNLVVIAGMESMPHAFDRGALHDLLPVQKQFGSSSSHSGYVPQWTRASARCEGLLIADSQVESADLWREQFRRVPFYYLSSFCKAKPAALTLLGARERDRVVQIEDEATQRVLMAWHEVGAGSVVYLASPVSYLLRFRRGDELHNRFWGQLLRWVTATERGQSTGQVVLSTSAMTYPLGAEVDVIVTVNDENGSPLQGASLMAVADSPTAEPIHVPLKIDENVPGRYAGSFANLAAGTYRLRPVGDALDALHSSGAEGEDSMQTAIITVVAPDNIELMDTSCNHALLRELAQVTGGQVIPPTAIEEVVRLSATSPRVVENTTRNPQWDKWRYLWLVVGCLGVEWGIRRRIGVV